MQRDIFNFIKNVFIYIYISIFIEIAVIATGKMHFCLIKKKKKKEGDFEVYVAFRI